MINYKQYRHSSSSSFRIAFMQDFLIDRGIATGDEIRLVTSINGTNEDSYNSILYSRTGYRTIEQFLDCEKV